MNSSKLDQLKIEREPETESGGTGRFAWLILLLVLLGASAWWFMRPAPAIEVSTAVAREISNQVASTVLNASGYVTARRQATVSSKFTGKVVEVLIEEGMQVEEGQLLARLDDANVRASYNLAEAQRRSATSSLKETQALLSEAQANLGRTKNLVDRGLSSAAELDRVEAIAGSLDAQLERKQADVKVAEQQVAVWQQQLEDTLIRAPFAGVVVAKNAQPGEMISPISAGGGFTRTGIGTIVDMTSLEIEIDVNEAYINRVAAGQKVFATLDAYPDWRIPCHVIAIIPTADRQRATVEVRVGFDELDPRILPDMGVKVAFQDDGPVRSGSAGVVVPAAAVRSAGGQDIVLVVRDGVVERRAVSSNGTRGDGIMLSAGLAAGEHVVTAGPEGLADGDQVKEKTQ